MKTLRWMAVLLVSLPLLASCHFLDIDDEPELIIDPPVWGRFVFDDDGVPGSREMEAVAKEVFNRAVVGYGWKWEATREILPDGSVGEKDYWQNMIGKAPENYFFGQEQMTAFFCSDARQGQLMHRDFPYSYDEADNGVYAGGRRILQILSCDVGSDYLWCVELLGYRDERAVYGVTTMKRLTSRELEEMREKYAVEWDETQSL
ncbi:MAG: hypothetical protein IJV27_11940 [Prevotella sp.]|nr:hypothetical protein [Prevotella sp.]